MNDISIMYCIITTKKYSDRINNIIETWLSNVNPKDYYFFSDEENIEKKILKTTDKSGYYEDLSYKLFNGIRYIIENHINEYDWFMICDDDTYVFKNELKILLKDINENIPTSIGYLFKDYPNINHGLDVPKYTTKYTEWFAGGPGFLINRELMKLLYDHITPNDIEKIPGFNRFSDLALSCMIKSVNGKMIHSDLFNQNTPENEAKYNINKKEVINNISFHYVKGKKLFEDLSKYDFSLNNEK